MTVVKGKHNVAGRSDDMRLLVAFEEAYRAYGGAIAAAVGALRPHIRVEATGVDSLPQDLARFRPQAVISSRPEGPEIGARVAWVEIPPEPDRPAHARLGDRHFDLINPPLEKVLELIDEAELLVRSG